MALNHAKSGEIVDLHPLGGGLREAHTTALVKSESFEAVRLVVRAGAEIPSHHVSGSFTLHCIEGRVRLGLAQGSQERSAGPWGIGRASCRERVWQTSEDSVGAV